MSSSKHALPELDENVLDDSMKVAAGLAAGIAAGLAADHAAALPALTALADPSAVWGRIQLDVPVTYEDCRDILLMNESHASISFMHKGGEYVGGKVHEAGIRQLTERPEVLGVIRVMRKVKGEHAIWCLFNVDGANRAVRCKNVDALLSTTVSLFTAPPRRNDDAAGMLGDNSYLSSKVRNGKRANFIDVVEKSM